MASNRNPTMPRGKRAAEKKRLEEYWNGPGKARSPFKNNLYDFANSGLKGARIKPSELKIALQYLATITHDEVFQTASGALTAYGLHEGNGLEATTKRLLRQTGRTTLDDVALRMPDRSQKSAEMAASQYGVPGTSFRTVVRELTKARKDFEQRRSEGRDNPPFPDGDTGRHLLVRFSCARLGGDNQQIRSLFGVDFDDDGFAVVPDNRLWRNEIRDGWIVSFGQLSDDDPLGMRRRQAWEKAPTNFRSLAKDESGTRE